MKMSSNVEGFNDYHSSPTVSMIIPMKVCRMLSAVRVSNVK
jgi:hypothetical protein